MFVDTMMVWEYMATQGVGNLHFIEDIMNKHVYVNILRERIEASDEKFVIQEHFAFYSVSDPKHSSHFAGALCLYNCTKVIKIAPQ
jgi:hypothetical protein